MQDLEEMILAGEYEVGERENEFREAKRSVYASEAKGEGSRNVI